MRKFKLIAAILALLLLLSACGEKGEQPDASSSNAAGNTSGESGESGGTGSLSASEMFTDRDRRTEYDESASAHITLNGDSISTDSKDVTVKGTTATITGEGTYIISGTLRDGMIVVNAGKKARLQLVLDGADITSATSAPLYILEAGKVFVTLAEGTENTLTNGGSFVAVDDNNIDGAVYAKDDLTFNGSGRLTVNSPAGHGIVAKDDLVITGGSYTINCASHGMDVNDSVRLTDASITIYAGKDGIHSDNDEDESLGYVYIESGSFDISAEGDGISASSTLEIDGGDFNIVTGGGAVNGAKQSSDNWGGFMGGFGGGGMGGGRPGGRSASNAAYTTTASSDDSTSIKGLKAGVDLIINGGTFNIDSADDAVHSNNSVVINGGAITIATGDDGVHADESLNVTGGTIKITESYEGLEALNIVISGGDIDLVARDDGINAAGGADQSGFGGDRGGDRFGGGFGGGFGGSSSNGTILISGGTIYINASGDGIDANGSFEISGGHTTIVGPTTGDTATLDYDVSGIITGGTFMGTGASGMAQTFSDSTQGVIAVTCGTQAAGTQITLTDSAGNTLFSFAPELGFQVVILSSPDMVSGESYTLSVGTITKTLTAN